LLGVLCLMRYEDWTFRETEVRLREHRELRRVLKLRSVPDYTTLYRFLKRLDDKKIDQALGDGGSSPPPGNRGPSSPRPSGRGQVSKSSAGAAQQSSAQYPALIQRPIV